MDREKEVRKARRQPRFWWEAQTKAVPYAGGFDAQESLQQQSTKKKLQEGQKASKKRITGSEEGWISA